MNVGESIAVNTLLRWLLEMPRISGGPSTDDEAKVAAMKLAEQANKTLSAGLHGGEVASLWHKAVELKRQAKAKAKGRKP